MFDGKYHKLIFYNSIKHFCATIIRIRRAIYKLNNVELCNCSIH